MTSRPREHRYCRCGTLLARDNPGRQCARCERDCRDKLIAPPEVPADFWRTDPFREAFAARHMGRISRLYRLHPHHQASYGLDGISQTLLGQWMGLRQPQISRFENGPPLQLLDTLQHWARVLRIPVELLWFRMPRDQTPLVAGDSAERPAQAVRPSGQRAGEPVDDAGRDPVLTASWTHRGTVEAVVELSGGDRMRRRIFLSLTGPALTAPAHQWLIHEPEPLISGLSGRRVSARLVERMTAMTTELRKLDDVAGGGSVLGMAEQEFAWVAGLLDRASYDDATGRALHRALADLGQLCGWAAYDAADLGLAQRYYIAALRAAHSADDRPFGAHILSFMAKGATDQGQPAEGITFIETALTGTRGQATPALLAELHYRQAYAFAALQDTPACLAAISRARTHAEQLAPENEPPWLYWLSPGNIAVSAGRCLLDLGQAEQAVAMLNEGVAQSGESFVRYQQFTLTYLAEAHARPGRQHDLEAAAGLGMTSLDLAETLDSTRGTTRLRYLSRQLRPHAAVPAVHDFLDRVKNSA